MAMAKVSALTGADSLEKLKVPADGPVVYAIPGIV